jgi:REP element-mobilizing transposase RayT
MNRGVARRPLYEHREDMRAFLALAAQQVRARRIEIHAFSLMGTHFHLLVRSMKGVLPEALRQIQNRFSRWFNRKNKRDGPLFRGRYLAKLTDDPDYRRAVSRNNKQDACGFLLAGLTACSSRNGPRGYPEQRPTAKASDRVCHVRSATGWSVVCEYQIVPRMRERLS